MGLGKNIKDMKDMVAAAPGMVDQAQQMQEAAAAQQAAAMSGATMPEVDAALLEPIEGISLERYAALSKTVGEQKLDEDSTRKMVEKNGHTYEQWRAAYDGWNARFKDNMALSSKFGMIYQQAETL